jgi:hypothetical protein
MPHAARLLSQVAILMARQSREVPFEGPLIAGLSYADTTGPSLSTRVHAFPSNRPATLPRAKHDLGGWHVMCRSALWVADGCERSNQLDLWKRRMALGCLHVEPCRCR